MALHPRNPFRHRVFEEDLDLTAGVVEIADAAGAPFHVVGDEDHHELFAIHLHPGFNPPEGPAFELAVRPLQARADLAGALVVMLLGGVHDGAGRQKAASAVPSPCSWPPAPSLWSQPHGV